jgi:hypothetical protein
MPERTDPLLLDLVSAELLRAAEKRLANDCEELRLARLAAVALCPCRVPGADVPRIDSSMSDNYLHAGNSTPATKQISD